MQSLAREAALAAANRAENVSTSIEAAADMERDQSSSATQQVCSASLADRCCWKNLSAGPAHSWRWFESFKLAPGQHWSFVVGYS